MFIETRQLFHWRRSFHKGREFARCRRLVAGILMSGAAAIVQAAPTGGVVSSGSATITPGTDTVIDQSSQRVDIDWTGFDTTANESVLFNQQHDAASIAINRISGARTRFDGTLEARGRDGTLATGGTIFLINQNGITFGSTAQINVGSLLATTSDTDRIEEDEIQVSQHGQTGVTVYHFSGNGEYASIINEGDITVSNGGFAVLAAPNVQNHGFIRADLGQVELASTQDYDIQVDFRGDGLIFFSPGNLPEQFEGSLEPGEELGVTNTGTLQSRSGHVYLTANMAMIPVREARDIVEGVVNLSGVVDADQFVDNGNGGTAIVAAVNGHEHTVYPGGDIVVTSTGDINIGGGADIHAVGGGDVRGLFQAGGDITMGSEGDTAKITLKADSDAAENRGHDAYAEAELEMLALGGSLDIAAGEIEVTARAVAGDGMIDNGIVLPEASVPDGHHMADAVASAHLLGERVDINADISVVADAQATTTGDIVNEANATNIAQGGREEAAEALAALDILAVGESDGDSYPQPGDLALRGEINVAANALTDDSRASMATANTVLAAVDNIDVEGNIDVDAVAVSEAGDLLSPPLYPLLCEGPACNNGHAPAAADANAALLMLGGAPDGLLEPLFYLSRNEPAILGTLSDILTLSNAQDLIAIFEEIGGIGFDIGPIGHGEVNYKGDINVTSLAQFDAIGAIELPVTGVADATAAAVIAGGGDTFIDTDPIRVESEAYANYDEFVYYEPDDYLGPALDFPIDSLDTEARSTLVFAAGLGDLGGSIVPLENGSINGDYTGSDLTILGDVSATAYELETLNGEPQSGPVSGPYSSPGTSAGAITALLATGDIQVRGADPLAEATLASVIGVDDELNTARVQARSSQWQECIGEDCLPVEDGIEGLDRFVDGVTVSVAQLIIEAGGDIDIQPKTKTQPAGLFKDPIGPEWPGRLPLRFAADGRMLVATGADATRPPRIVALGSDVEQAILGGADPSVLLPATASGGCLAAGLDAFTISGSDYFDRLISASCGRTK